MLLQFSNQIEFPAEQENLTSHQNKHSFSLAIPLTNQEAVLYIVHLDCTLQFRFTLLPQKHLRCAFFFKKHLPSHTFSCFEKSQSDLFPHQTAPLFFDLPLITMGNFRHSADTEPSPQPSACYHRGPIRKHSYNL